MYSMNLSNQLLFGIPVTTSNCEEIIDQCGRFLKDPRSEGKCALVSTTNPEIIIAVRKSTFLSEFLKESDVVIPDGVGIVWALQVLNKKPRVTRIAGVDLMEFLVSLASRNGYKVALIGSRHEVAHKAFETLQKAYPQLHGWSENGPELKVETSANWPIKDQSLKYTIVDSQSSEYFVKLVEKIRSTGVRMVFVGLGVPKQEWFIAQLNKYLNTHQNKSKTNKRNQNHSEKNPPLLLMSVGGSFDMICGKLPRAPIIFQKLGLEWLWRLILEPHRLARQISLFKFFLLTLKAKFMIQ